MSKESTTPALVALVRVAWEVANRRDLDVLVTLYTPDAVWDASNRGVGTYEGRSAIRRLLGEWFGSYAEWHAEVEETLDFGNGVAFAVTRQRARLADSTGMVETREAFVYEFAENLVSRITNYGDVAEGRAAAERLAAERG